ncbi:MAG: hypothetical protein JNJ99_13990 [Crocinitomicaceae bacterium]|nr:hypothetical protein [Crocinitomicaceae bacterium]
MGINIGERISTEDHPGSTTVIISPFLERWKLILMTTWFLAFTFVGFYMIYLLSGGAYALEVIGDNVEDIRDQQLVYLIVFLGFWAYFEYKIGKAILWYHFGKEFIRLDSDSFSHKRAILGYGRSNRYFYENMKQIELFESDSTAFGQFFENAYWSLGTDGITFTYFGKSKSFGRRLDEKTSKKLLNFLDDKIKTLRKKK